jgi:hypothetical protein
VVALPNEREDDEKRHSTSQRDDVHFHYFRESLKDSAKDFDCQLKRINFVTVIRQAIRQKHDGKSRSIAVMERGKFEAIVERKWSSTVIVAIDTSVVKEHCSGT